MALLRLFRTPKHQQFEYKTRYWDPRKEELEERLKQLDSRKDSGIEATKARISGGFRGKGYMGHKESGYRKQQTQRSNFILLGVVVVLLVVSYLFLAVYLPRIVQLVEQGG